MRSFASGILAGLCATVVLSALLVLMTMAGILPELDIIGMLAAMVARGTSTGWFLHFAIGAFWGIGFSAIHDFLPGGNEIVEGMVFGLIAWLLMMLLIMPMVGGGVFGLTIGIMAPIITAVLHIIFGAVMGLTYRALS